MPTQGRNPEAVELGYDAIDWTPPKGGRLSDAIYEPYAGAFAVIHNNLDAAMEAANITGREGTLNRQAKSAARSAFES
ncbi:hypothetical protein, partial [Phenylobacterium sp.]|uniref:hypothetical protein n=1 Tax=Phenylobacterium sp. TaxID=1871053 RepID=UPI0025FEF3FB